MEKSIETIWNDGFLKSESSFIVPKINNLYKRKSEHTIDKLIKMGEYNLIIIMFSAIVILITSISLGYVYTGTFIFSLLVFLVLYGAKQGAIAKKISKGSNSYQYIKDIDNWLKETILGYTKIYRVFYPLFFLTFVIRFSFTEMFDSLVAKVLLNFPDTYTLAGVPIFMIAIVITITVLLSVFAGRIYDRDLKLVYGKVFEKLNELIVEMEELRR